ncbi:helix-turn-helix domain-containing protein [Streptomyces sp. 5-10]|uniref:helix-turn-helix domain-containing protein n=1 Tax=Streptomyces sp. 5-10 TaxID=878925 RepID=UPI001CC309BA|nr:helix-turn-helix domain-containing protein [Streptomyces sp. 5-10]
MQHARRFLYQSGGVRLTPQQRPPRHVTGGEREEISRGIAAGESARQLARRLGRSPSTVSREIARNGGRDRYRAASADATAYARGRRPKPAKLAQRPALRALVEAKLALCRPPEQIAGWLRRQFPGDASLQVSQEAIHLSLFDPRRRQAIDRSLAQRLRTARPVRRPKLARRPTGRGVIRGMVSITARPAEVEDRKIPGPWEGGGTPHDGHPAFGRRHTRRAHQPLHGHRCAAGRHQGRAGHSAPRQEPPRHPAPATTNAHLGPGPGGPSTRPSPPRPGCRSTSASRAARGSAAPTRTPTDCCGSTSRLVLGVAVFVIGLAARNVPQDAGQADSSTSCRPQGLALFGCVDLPGIRSRLDSTEA